MRRYHFVEGLACDWKEVEIQEHTKTKKFISYPSPFSFRIGAHDASDKLFNKFQDSILLVSCRALSNRDASEWKKEISAEIERLITRCQ